MNTVTICAASVVASILAIILKKNNTEYSIILIICTCSILVTYIAGTVIEAISGIRELFSKTEMNISYLTIILKCVGICFLTEFTCDTCKDVGQASLAGIVLFSGRIFVIITALPLFGELIKLVTDLIGG